MHQDKEEAGVPEPRSGNPRVEFVKDSQLGWGRRLGGEDTLRFFDSPIEPETVVSATGRDFKAGRLPLQARAWWFDGDKWLVGRVDIPADSNASSYWINFPNHQTARVPTEDLRVRWACPISDPLSLVKARTVETRFFHTHRTSYARNVARQRTACLNLRGLLSSAVEIYDHQVGAARRVLSDPIPRYLLADEVGLGKTIEAGMVIRQLLLDSGGNVTVVVPDHLVGQWENELDSKFGVFQLSGVLDVVPQSEVEKLPNIQRTLLVVDEAHRMTELVDYNDSTEASRKYHALKEIAHAADALLLLSATPVRSNEDAFLGILHLLDPATYPLEDLVAFRRRVELRDDLAEAMSALDDETPIRYLVEPLQNLHALLPDDVKLGDLVTEAIQETENRNIDAARTAVRQVRIHISETYRLHRRMIRTRRSSAIKGKFPVRGRERSNPWLIPDPDRRRGELLSMLESVRLELLEQDISNAGSIFRVVLGRALGPLTALADIAIALRDAGDHDLSADEIEALSGFIGTDTALNLARQIDALLVAESNADRITATAQWCQHKVGRGKYAIACSFPRTAAEIAAALTAAYGSHRVITLLASQSDEERTEALAKFASSKELNLLVFDRSVEEGANLQIAEEVLHVNLPTVTTQLEQRMGRLDRFSDVVLNRVQSTTFKESDDSRQEQLGAWLRVLDGLFNVFESSTSTLQYVLADLEREFFTNSITNGMVEAAHELETRSGFLEVQRRKITSQDLLDSIEDRSDDEALANALHETDRYQGDIEDAAVGYIHDMLQFSLHYTESGSLKFGINQTKRPLLTESDINSIGTYLFQREYTADRFAVRRGTGFLRYGEPLIDRFAEYSDRDDRGRAFAVELPTPAKASDRPPLLAFCFDFTVSAGPIGGDDDAIDPAFQRAVKVRTEHFLPTSTERVWWVVGHGECPTSWRQDLESRQGNNLGSEPERFRELTSKFDWSVVCDEAYESARTCIRDRPWVTTKLAQAMTRAREAAERERSILDARSNPSDRAKIDENVLSAVDDALANPVFTLDNCGAVFLTWVPRR
ncbi:protein DpdE [Mycolicibacterium sp. XJ662]